MSELKSSNEETKLAKLLGNIGRLFSTRADQSVERMGLYRGQAFLLMILSDSDGQTHSEIAEKLEISPAAATKVIKRMEALGYVQRRSDAADERVSRVFLEVGGWAVIREIRHAFDQLDQLLVSRLTAEEQPTLVALLWKVYHGLSESPGGAMTPSGEHLEVKID